MSNFDVTILIVGIIIGLFLQYLFRYTLEKQNLTPKQKQDLIKNEAPDLDDNWSDISEEDDRPLANLLKDKTFAKKLKQNEYNQVMKDEFGFDDLKMVFVVRQDLKMGTGKIGA